MDIALFAFVLYQFNKQLKEWFTKIPIYFRQVAIDIRLDRIQEKWSEQVSQLSVVRICANLKNATPILVPRPKDDMHRPSKNSDAYY